MFGIECPAHRGQPARFLVQCDSAVAGFAWGSGPGILGAAMRFTSFEAAELFRRRALGAFEFARIVGLEPAMLAPRLGLEDVEGWVCIGGTKDGTVRMDAFGREVLGVDNDDLIHLRRVETPTVPKGLAGTTR